MATQISDSSEQVSKLFSNPDRIVSIEGGITDLTEQEEKILSMSEVSNAPIDIIISSPGGSVVAGIFFINAMERVKARGVKIRCLVDKMAASMAMHILGNCSERYALAGSLLLWHPAYININFGRVTKERAGQIKEQLHILTYQLEENLRKALGLSVEVYEKHWRAEHFIPAKYLKDFISPHFIIILDDF